MIWPVALTVLGLFIGSFLNVCIHRIPRCESIVWPASHCPKCLTPIRPWDNIPVLSYLFLLGKCRSCSAKISLRYPMVEILSALLCISLYLRFGLSPEFLIYYVWVCILLVITFIDLDYQIIPDSLSIGGIILGLIAVFWLPLSYKTALIGLALGSGLLIAIIYGYYFLTKRQGMGGGDVKLLGMIGVFTGWEGVLFTIFCASLIGSVVGVTWVIIRKKGMLAAIPFGPFLSLGAIVYVLWGAKIINWYLGYIS
ncbi:MAG: prepilin peptidase [Deltaproteobacteria bacterium]|nr:prepilin peptidase [Deltaproteobacteria bacterium]